MTGAHEPATAAPGDVEQVSASAMCDKAAFAGQDIAVSLQVGIMDIAGNRLARQEPGQPFRLLSVRPAGCDGLGGEGEAGLRGGPAGDLYIFIEVREHAIFQRDGVNLYCRIPVSMATAALGGEVEVPTIDGGRSMVKVPAGSQTGKQMRLRGKGMPALRGGGSGDMLIEVAVETPINLTTRQRELLREFEALSENNNPEATSFFSKVKNFWDGMTK